MRWPDARRHEDDRFEDVLANYTVEIREGDSEPRYPYAEREKAR